MILVSAAGTSSLPPTSLPQAPRATTAGPSSSTTAPQWTATAAQVHQSPLYKQWLAAQVEAEQAPAERRTEAQQRATQLLAQLRADAGYTRFEMLYARDQAQGARQAAAKARGEQRQVLLGQAAVYDAAAHESHARALMIDAGRRFDAVPDAPRLAARQLELQQAVAQAQERYNREDAQYRQAQATHQQDLNTAVASGGGFGSGFDLFGLGKSKKEREHDSLTVRHQAHEAARKALDEAKHALDDFNGALSPGFRQAQADMRQAQAGWQQADATLRLQETRFRPPGGTDAASQERAAQADVAAADVHTALAAQGDPLDPELQARAFMADPARLSQDWAWQVHARFGPDAHLVRDEPSLRALVEDSQALRAELADPSMDAERDRVTDAVVTRLRDKAGELGLQDHRVVVASYSYATVSKELGSGRGNGLLYSLLDANGSTVVVVDGLVAAGQDKADAYASVDAFVDDNTLPGTDAALAVMDNGRARVEADTATPRIAMRVLTGGAHEEEAFERWTRQHPKLVTGLTIGAAVVLSLTPGVMAAGRLGAGRLASWMAGRHAVALTGAQAATSSAGSSAAGRTLLAVQGTALGAITAYGGAAFVHMRSQERARGQSMSVDTAMQGVTVLSSLAALSAMGAAYAHAGQAGTPGGARAAQVATWANRVAWTGYVPVAYDLHRLSTHNAGQGLRPGEQEQLWLNLAMDLLPELGARAATRWVDAQAAASGPTEVPTHTAPPVDPAITPIVQADRSPTRRPATSTAPARAAPPLSDRPLPSRGAPLRQPEQANTASPRQDPDVPHSAVAFQLANQHRHGDDLRTLDGSEHDRRSHRPAPGAARPRRADTAAALARAARHASGPPGAGAPRPHRPALEGLRLQREGDRLIATHAHDARAEVIVDLPEGWRPGRPVPVDVQSISRGGLPPRSQDDMLVRLLEHHGVQPSRLNYRNVVEEDTQMSYYMNFGEPEAVSEDAAAASVLGRSGTRVLQALGVQVDRYEWRLEDGLLDLTLHVAPPDAPAPYATRRAQRRHEQFARVDARIRAMAGDHLPPRPSAAERATVAPGDAVASTPAVAHAVAGTADDLRLPADDLPSDIERRLHLGEVRDGNVAVRYYMDTTFAERMARIQVRPDARGSDMAAGFAEYLGWRASAAGSDASPGGYLRYLTQTQHTLGMAGGAAPQHLPHASEALVAEAVVRAVGEDTLHRALFGGDERATNAVAAVTTGLAQRFRQQARRDAPQPHDAAHSTWQPSGPGIARTATGPDAHRADDTGPLPTPVAMSPTLQSFVDTHGLVPPHQLEAPIEAHATGSGDEAAAREALNQARTQLDALSTQLAANEEPAPPGLQQYRQALELLDDFLPHARQADTWWPDGVAGRSVVLSRWMTEGREPAQREWQASHDRLRGLQALGFRSVVRRELDQIAGEFDFGVVEAQARVARASSYENAAGVRRNVHPASPEAAEMDRLQRDAVVTGLGEPVDRVLALYPELQQQLRSQIDRGLVIGYGETPEGAAAVYEPRGFRITVSPTAREPDGTERAWEPEEIASLFVHELAHSELPNLGHASTRDSYVSSLLRDEARAAFAQWRLREVSARLGGPVVPAPIPTGVPEREFLEIYARLLETGDLDEATRALAAITGRDLNHHHGRHYTEQFERERGVGSGWAVRRGTLYDGRTEDTPGDPVSDERPRRPPMPQLTEVRVPQVAGESAAPDSGSADAPRLPIFTSDDLEGLDGLGGYDEMAHDLAPVADDSPVSRAIGDLLQAVDDVADPAMARRIEEAIERLSDRLDADPQGPVPDDVQQLLDALPPPRNAETTETDNAASHAGGDPDADLVHQAEREIERLGTDHADAELLSILIRELRSHDREAGYTRQQIRDGLADLLRGGGEPPRPGTAERPARWQEIDQMASDLDLARVMRGLSREPGRAERAWQPEDLDISRHRPDGSEIIAIGPRGALIKGDILPGGSGFRVRYIGRGDLPPGSAADLLIDVLRRLGIDGSIRQVTFDNVIEPRTREQFLRNPDDASAEASVLGRLGRQVLDTLFPGERLRVRFDWHDGDLHLVVWRDANGDDDGGARPVDPPPQTPPPQSTDLLPRTPGAVARPADTRPASAAGDASVRAIAEQLRFVAEQLGALRSRLHPAGIPEPRAVAAATLDGANPDVVSAVDGSFGQLETDLDTLQRSVAEAQDALFDYYRLLEHGRDSIPTPPPHPELGPLLAELGARQRQLLGDAQEPIGGIANALSDHQQGVDPERLGEQAGIVQSVLADTPPHVVLHGHARDAQAFVAPVVQRDGASRAEAGQLLQALEDRLDAVRQSVQTSEQALHRARGVVSRAEPVAQGLRTTANATRRTADAAEQHYERAAAQANAAIEESARLRAAVQSGTVTPGAHYAARDNAERLRTQALQIRTDAIAARRAAHAARRDADAAERALGEARGIEQALATELAAHRGRMTELQAGLPRAQQAAQQARSRFDAARDAETALAHHLDVLASSLGSGNDAADRILGAMARATRLADDAQAGLERIARLIATYADHLQHGGAPASYTPPTEPRLPPVLPGPQQPPDAAPAQHAPWPRGSRRDRADRQEHAPAPRAGAPDALAPFRESAAASPHAGQAAQNIAEPLPLVSTFTINNPRTARQVARLRRRLDDVGERLGPDAAAVQLRWGPMTTPDTLKPEHAGRLQRWARTLVPHAFRGSWPAGYPDRAQLARMFEQHRGEPLVVHVVAGSEQGAYWKRADHAWWDSQDVPVWQTVGELRALGLDKHHIVRINLARHEDWPQMLSDLKTHFPDQRVSLQIHRRDMEQYADDPRALAGKIADITPLVEELQIDPSLSHGEQWAPAHYLRLARAIDETLRERGLAPKPVVFAGGIGPGTTAPMMQEILPHDPHAGADGVSRLRRPSVLGWGGGVSADKAARTYEEFVVAYRSHRPRV